MHDIVRDANIMNTSDKASLELEEKMKFVDSLHHELIDTLPANEIHEFIANEINGLEMQLSSSIAQLIVGGQKAGKVSGVYMDISNLNWNTSLRPSTSTQPQLLMEDDGHHFGLQKTYESSNMREK